MSIKSVFIYFLFYPVVQSINLNIDYLQLENRLRYARKFPKGTHEITINSIEEFKNNVFNIPDISGVKNITVECLEDMWLLFLASKNSSSVPSEFLHTAAMGRSLMMCIVFYNNEYSE